MIIPSIKEAHHIPRFIFLVKAYGTKIDFQSSYKLNIRKGEYKLIHLLIVLVVLGLILYIVQYVLGAIPFPEPLRTVINVAFVVIVALIAISVLLQFAGMGGGFIPNL